MAYKALYRKYRPNTFDEVVGQQHVVMTLQNAIKNNKLAHAYLFCGPRGTGKTTIAKILAKTINCQSEGANKPCCQCPSCIDIQESNHPDVIEMDAATNNGVDEVREIVDKVKFAPMNGKYKVYIIDEVHMMTSGAFNALLKTLEEPPEYCIFILATTEPHKVLPTIVSRCQRFDFKKIAKPVLKGNISKVCDKEGIQIEESAIDLIASLAEGGMRDALSILDQCIAYAQNNITLEDVSSVYGVATLSEKISLFECVKNKDSKKMIEKTKKISSAGIDIQRLTTDLIDIAKESVIYAYSKNTENLSVLTANDAEHLLGMFTTTELLKYVDYLIDTQGKYRDATNSMTYFEICLLKMMDYKQETITQTYIPIQSSYQQEIRRDTTTIQTQQANAEPKEKQYKEYSDEEKYNILISANKQLKEIDNKIIPNMSIAKLSEKEKSLMELVRRAEIMASSQDRIILTVANRTIANEINELNNNQIIEAVLKANLPSEKQIIAITTEERDYLITYFRNRQNQKPKEEEKVEEKTEDKGLENLAALFGKDGYDVVEE